MDHFMQAVIKTVNYIRSHALSHRHFKEFLKVLYSKYGDVYLGQVRWLSLVRCFMKRFYELQEEIDLFIYIYIL